jgi:hypothetical protein
MVIVFQVMMPEAMQSDISMCMLYLTIFVIL